tara:strand:+ start:9524 stop:10501 length:978 start_codon:yes stop_codon:yes gene_type:complete
MKIQTFVKSPLRLSLFGGGTDIPYIYKELGRGCTITAALDLFVAVGCSSLPFFNGIKLKYSNNETVQKLDSIIHPIFKEALSYFDYDPLNNNGLELISTASIPSGTGLGSSAAFTTSLVQCLSMHLKDEKIDQKSLLEISTKIEHLSGNDQIGYQDQVSSIFGSITKAIYHENNIEIIPASINWKNGMRNLLEKKGYLYKTNSRKGISSNFINKEELKTKLNHYEKVLSIAEKVNVNSDNFNENEILDFFIENSMLAKKVKVRTKEIKEFEDEITKYGAVYTKQLGAGGGGFIFCIFEDENPKLPKDILKNMIRPKIIESGTTIL